MPVTVECRATRRRFVLMGLVALVWFGLPPLAARAGQGDERVVSIDRTAWEKWGFRYPATYVFRLEGVEADAEVTAWQRDDASRPWTALPAKTSTDFFNGVECVRVDRNEGRAYVSVGFDRTNTIHLRFDGVRSADFESIAKYYDDRRAAYTLSNDNWGRRSSSNPGAPWRGMTDDASDSYQASVHACREFRIPVSIAINSRSAGGEAMWARMQEELDRRDSSWEPAVHSSTHPCSGKAYAAGGYEAEILGCRDEIVKRLKNVPYGQQTFEFILPCGYRDEAVERACRGEFLFLRAWNTRDNPGSTAYVPWNAEHGNYGIGGFQTASYDTVLEAREPKARYYAGDVAALNTAVDEVFRTGGIFYAMWHADRYRNSVVYDPRPGIDGVQGSTLMQHWAHVAGRRDVWYVANGWLYAYRYVAENAHVD